MVLQFWRAELAPFVRCGRRRFLSVPRRRRRDARSTGAGDATAGQPPNCGAPGTVFQGASDEVRLCASESSRGGRSDGARRARRAAAHTEEPSRLVT